MTYQSPVSPGYSWYEDTIGDRPAYPPLDGDKTCDVVIVGGGFTGLSAAVHLAKAGTNVVLIEAHRFGDGASGRNGGQLGTGQRAGAEEMEAEYGFERAKSLFDLAEEAKTHLLEFAEINRIEIDFRPGHLNVAHRKRDLPEYLEHAEAMQTRFNYPHIAYMDFAETSERLGSTHYFGGVRDTGTGHIHPLKLVVGTARVAAQAGAKLFETTPATGVEAKGGKVLVTTPTGTITAQKCLLAIDAYSGDLERTTASHIMPIGSFIGATVDLGADSPVLPGGESVSRLTVCRSLFPPRQDRGTPFRRTRNLRGEGSERHPHSYSPTDQRDLPEPQGCRDHPRLGRLCRHHHAAQTVRARGDAQRDFGGRLFRPWRDTVEFRRQALCRDHLR